MLLSATAVEERRVTTKLSISFTDTHAKLIEDAVKSGQYASASEFVREALRTWARSDELGRLWDEGVASGRARQQLSMAEIKAEARKRMKRRAK
jgi:antitoxin ParD1/3/4